jgi:hypothetical protein
VLEGALFHLRKTQRPNHNLIFRIQGHCQKSNLKIFQLNETHPTTWVLGAVTTPEEFSPSPQAQWQDSSALGIFTV